MLRVQFFLFFMVSLLLTANAQGWNPNPNYDKTTVWKPRQMGHSWDNSDDKVDLKSYTPTIGDQKNIGSCVLWATMYAIATQKAKLNGITDKKRIDSLRGAPLFIYNQLLNPKDESGCSQGCRFEDAFKRIMEVGLYPFSDFPTDNCHSSPNNAQKQKTILNVIDSYEILFVTAADSSYRQIKIQNALAEGLPVIIGAKVPESFVTPLLHSKAKHWIPAQSEKGQGTNHAMVVVGYDDNLKSFEVMNSWGREWGNGGFIWIPYSAFNKICGEAYVLKLNKSITPPPAPPIPVTFTGKFSLKTSEYDWSKNQKVTQKVEIKHEGNQSFSPKNNDFSVGTGFQMVIPIEKPCYVYIFSKNPPSAKYPDYPEGKLVLNYASERLIPDNDNYRGELYRWENDDLIPKLKMMKELILPDTNKVMRLSYPGIDESCILFCREKIDANNVLRDLALLKGSLQSRVTTYFNNTNAFIPVSEISYQGGEEVSFSAKDWTKGYIVPIFLSVKAK